MRLRTYRQIARFTGFGALLAGLLAALTPAQQPQERIALRSAFTDQAVVSPGAGPAELAFPVDRADWAAITVLSNSATLRVSLVDPAGREHAAESTDAAVAASYIVRAQDPSSQGSSYNFDLKRPTPGPWKIRAAETADFNTARAVLLSVNSMGGVGVALAGTNRDYATGQTIPLGLIVADARGGLPRSAVSSIAARVRTGDGTVSLPVTFADDGAGKDGQADDGGYVATFTLDTPGTYDITARIDGTRDGNAFARTVAGSFRVVNRCGTIQPGVQSAVGADGSLELTFSIDAARAGDFRVAATLATTDGKSISDSATARLDAGGQSAKVRFPSTHLQALGVNGPYQVAQATLYCVDGGDTDNLDVYTSNQQVNMGTTVAIDLGQAAAATRPASGRFTLSGGSTEATADSDGNGRIDTLRVGVGLNVPEAGAFDWNATLTDSRGTAIDTAAGSGTLPAGSATAALQFQGSKIGKNGADGPYLIKNLLIYGSAAAGSFPVACRTKAYTADQFEGGPAPPARIDVNPGSLDFGNVAAGQAKDLTLTVRNVGGAPLSITSFAFTNASYQVTSPGAPFTLQAGGQQTVTIRFSPSTAGAQTGALRIASNTSSQPTVTVSLNGTGASPSAPQPSAQIPVRGIAYHQITALPDNGPDYRSSMALSGNGKVIVYAYAPGPNHIYTMNFDGAGQKEVDTYKSQCYCAPVVDVNDDGTAVVSSEGLQLRIADAKGARLLANVDSFITGIRITADGKKVYFLVNRDGHFLPANTTAQRGLYVINADGSGLKQIVGPDAVGAKLGASLPSSMSPEFTLTGSWPTPLGISRDGSRIVFGAKKYAQNGPDALFAVNGDGTNLRIMLGPLRYVYSVSLSSDGSKVAYVNCSGACNNLVTEAGVMNFDGTGARVLLANSGGGRVHLTADGSQALVWDKLFNTDGSGALQTGTVFNSLTPGSSTAMVMNSTGTRFLYAFVAPRTYSQGLSQMATAEINPQALGQAPALSNPQVKAYYVLTSADSTTTLSTKVDATNPVINVNYAIVSNGLVEDVVTGDMGLFDDGTNGDATARDGVYTTNIVRTSTRSAPGPRLLRVFAQVSDSAGKRHGALVDAAPFFVLNGEPSGPAPQIASLTLAGTQLTIAGSGFDPIAANNQVIVGPRLARVVSANSAGTQLVVVVPADSPPAQAIVYAAAQGLMSAGATFK